MPENECLFEGQFRIRLVVSRSNRLKHARMAVVGKEISLINKLQGTGLAGL
jgi:hypothetical protein